MKKSSIQLIGVCGLVGVLLLMVSFIINRGPGANPSLNELIQFKRTHYLPAVIGSWMQAVSPPLIVTFAIGMVFISGQNNKPAGWLTLIGGLILLIVSMVEVVFYFSALTGNTATTGTISMDMIAAVQRLYAIIAAPFFFFSLSAVLLRSVVLPAHMAYLGLGLGSGFFVLGVIQLFYPIQNIVDVMAMIQGLWWLAASVMVINRSARLSG